MNKRLAYIGGSLVTGLIAYVIINRQIKKGMIKKIYAELDGKTGDREKKRIEKIKRGKLSAKRTDAFNPLFYRAIGENPIPKDLALAKAKAIHDAWGVFNDDEEKVYGALRGLPSKLAVSFVTYWYNKQYETDLYSDLNTKLSDDEKKVAFGIVDKLKSK